MASAFGKKVASKFTTVNIARSVLEAFGGYSDRQVERFINRAIFDSEYAETLNSYCRAGRNEIHTTTTISPNDSSGWISTWNHTREANNAADRAGT